MAGNTGSPADRDYVNEAVDYFKNKLRWVQGPRTYVTHSRSHIANWPNFADLKGRQKGLHLAAQSSCLAGVGSY